MTVIFEDGFETGDFSKWTGRVVDCGTTSVVTDKKHHGSYSAKSVGNLSPYYRSYAYKTWGAGKGRTMYARAYFLMPTLPSSGKEFEILALYCSGDYSIASGGLTLKNDAGTYKIGCRYRHLGEWKTVYSSGIRIATNEWHFVELKLVISTSGKADGSQIVYYDGVSVASVSAIDNDDRGSEIQGVRAGNIGPIVAEVFGPIYIDCIKVADVYVEGETGRIKGLVIDKDTGAGIPATSIAINMKPTLTNPDGTYSVDIEPGTYVVKVSKVGYFPQQSAPVIVGAGATVTIDFELVKIVPIPDVIVIAYLAGTEVARTKTGLDGSFALPPLDAMKTYVVRAEKLGYQPVELSVYLDSDKDLLMKLAEILEHSTAIDVKAPTLVIEGEIFDVTVYAGCLTQSCDLRGKKVQIVTVSEKLLDNYDPVTKRSFTTFTLIAPTPGTYTMTAKFPLQSPHKESEKEII